VSYWAEFLQLDTAKAEAYYDHPFFGRWPAITSNRFGAGEAVYEGTYLSDRLQTEVLRSILGKLDLIGRDQQLPPRLHAQSGVNGFDRTVHFYFNYSGSEISFKYPHDAGTDLLTARPVAPGQTMTLAPWDLEIVEQNRK
jgi:beta-galactosidase